MAASTDTPNDLYWRGHRLMYGYYSDELGAYSLFLKVIEIASGSAEAAWSRQQIRNLESHWQWSTTIRTVNEQQEIEKVCIPMAQGRKPTHEDC